MCVPCRDKYKKYGETKRAKWKSEREQLEKELAARRAADVTSRARFDCAARPAACWKHRNVRCITVCKKSTQGRDDNNRSTAGAWRVPPRRRASRLLGTGMRQEIRRTAAAAGTAGAGVGFAAGVMNETRWAVTAAAAATLAGGGSGVAAVCPKAAISTQ